MIEAIQIHKLRSSGTLKINFSSKQKNTVRTNFYKQNCIFHSQTCNWKIQNSISDN